MNKITLQVTLTLDGDPDKNYVQQLAEKVAFALEHEANEVGLSPDDGPCIEEISVNSVSDPNGGHFKIAPVTCQVIP